MLRLLARRARAQWPLLAALLMVVTVGATLLGTCALLVTRTGGRALEVAASRATPGDVDVTAYTVTIRSPHARSVAEDTRAVLTSALAPFPATTAARASAKMRSLPAAGAGAETYLSGVEDLPARALLAAGRWPRAGAVSLEAVLLEPTARLLGLAPGDRVHIGAEVAGDAAPAVDVTVVGVVRPLPGAGWDRDPLAAAGYDLGYRDVDSLRTVRAYGPFIVDLADLLAGGCTIDRLEITAHPDLSAPDRRALAAVATTLSGADHRLAAALGDRVRIERIASRLPATLRASREQQRVTTGTVLAVSILGVVLAATALALAGRLTAGVRAGEATLLAALGTSRGQFAAATTVEAGALAVLAAALAVPASSALHAGLAHLPPLAGAGLTAGPAVTTGQVLAVAGGAFALAAVLVARAMRPAAWAGDRHPRAALLARSGADLLLVAFAAAGWWQLRAGPTASGSQVDAIRVLAPAVLLAAGAALALRLVLPALRGADRLARRARGLVLPLAVVEAARRPRAVAAGLLIGLACAAGTFGTAFDATWQRSQHDQADLSVGTDLAVTLTAPPVAGQGAAVAAATGGAVSPVVNRGVAVGQWLGSVGEATRLVAVDTARAGDLLRGRLDGGRTWAGVGAALSPPARATGVAVPAGAALTLTGTASGAILLAVTPRLLMQDATGLRTPCVGSPVPLDGRAHRLPECAPAEGLRLVAVSLPFTGPAGAVDGTGTDPNGSRVAVTLTVPGAGDAPPGSPWTATSAAPSPAHLTDPAVAVTGTPAGVQLRMTTSVRLTGPPEAARDLVATAFPVDGPVPVAVSARFADELRARPGARLSLTVGATPVPVTVAEVVPTVPSAPGAAAVLVDVDALSRALVGNGDLAFPVDAIWVGQPARPDAAERAGALHLGAVTTRAGEAARRTGGPLSAGLPAALRLLVPASALLLLAGIVLHVTCDLHLRALEVARLRGLGMTRREIRAVLLGQHAGVLLPLLATGAVVGALATRLVAPLLVRTGTGAAPVPGAVAHWPWAAEAALLAALVAGCTLAVTAVVAVQARRADAAHLRVAS
ncbi:FtsX-like permease family protein [Rhizomonospora bruguierae]|uniref:FtsX-like permease family protein n=1 Tax=Rhizomonospora bruguierae TaxID=1581705 RepID=UPI001BCEA9AB|nr:FtsX-like permease family protein [Micromonospora sp. NBRC 107566]